MRTISKFIAAAALSAISFSAAAFQLSFNVTVRDFRGAAVATNPDFNNTNISGLTTGMVASQLDSDGKPVYVGDGGGTNAAGNVASVDSFAAWYRSCDSGAFSCNSQHNVILTAEVDANDVLNYTNNAYFPLDALTNPSIWDDADAPHHNFFFTSELYLKLIYDPSKENVFKFTGDDDVWVFINGTLVMDLGGIHAATTGQFDLDDLVATLGINPYDEYDFKMFHAERHHTESNMSITSTLGQPLNKVPEPATVGLLGLGLIGLAGMRKRRAS